MPEQIPAAFISYCRDDQEFALRLAQDLKEAGAAVWLDQLDIRPGKPWDNAVEEALRSATKMLVLLTPTSVSSENVRDEIAYALKKGKIVIPVLYMECEIPLRLERKQHIDFRANYARGLELLLRELRVDNPNQAVLDKAAEGDVQRHLAWQAREAEAERLRLLDEHTREMQGARQAREEALRREHEAEAQRLSALEQQIEQAEADRLAREAEAEAQRQLELEQQQATEAADLLAGEAEARREQEAAAAKASLHVIEERDPPQDAASPAPQLQADAGAFTSYAFADTSDSSALPVLWIAGGIAAVILLVAIVVVSIVYSTSSRATTASQNTTLAADPPPAAPPPPPPARPSTRPKSDALTNQGFALIKSAHDSEALPLFTKACDAGSATGCYDLGWMYQYQRGVPQDNAAALALYIKSCNGGSSAGCSGLNHMYHDVLFDYDQSLTVTQRLAELAPTGGSFLNVAEANLTEGRFDACVQMATKASAAGLSAGDSIAGNAIKMACQWGKMGWADSLATARVLATQTSSLQKGSWNFAGTLHFVQGSPAFEASRDAWVALFISIQNGDSPKMVAALHKLEPVLQ